MKTITEKPIEQIKGLRMPITIQILLGLIFILALLCGKIYYSDEKYFKIIKSKESIVMTCRNFAYYNNDMHPENYKDCFEFIIN